MSSHYHRCYDCEVDLLPAPCACNDSDVYAHKCEDRDACEERAGAVRRGYVGDC